MNDILILTLTRGSLYALVSVGFALVFGAGRMLNLFHGSFYTLGAYAAVVLSATLAAGDGSVALALSVALAAAVAGLAGAAYYGLVLRPFADSPMRVMIVGLAANIVVSDVLRVLYGTTGARVPSLIGGAWTIGGVAVLKQEVLVGAVALVSFAALWIYLNRTRGGLAIRAVAQNRHVAELAGIRPDRILAQTVVAAAMLAGLAGALAAPTRVIGPDIWSFALLKSFAIVVVGGTGSLVGTLVAAYLLAGVEVSASAVWTPAVSEVVALGLIVAFLVARPQGLTGAAA